MIAVAREAGAATGCVRRIDALGLGGLGNKGLKRMIKRQVILKGMLFAFLGSAPFAHAAFSQTGDLVAGAVSSSDALVPVEVLGAWHADVDRRAFKLKVDYSVEIKINDGGSNMPVAIVSYFAGNADRPSTICRSQLDLVRTEGAVLIFEESLNYKGGKDPCPVWDQVAIEPKDDGSLWMQWRDARRRSFKSKMEAAAYRSNNALACRIVSGDGRSGGQEWCRDAEGNWAPKR